MEKLMARGTRFLVVGGVASILFGLIVAFWPGLSLLALVVLFGAFSFVYGLMGLGVGLELVAHRSTEWVPYILGGLAGIAIGAVTFFYPGITALALVYLIAAWAIVIGIFETIAAIDLHGKVNGAFWYGLAGVLSVAFGVLVAIYPGSGALAIVWMIGFYAFLTGVLRLVAAYRIHGLETKLTKVSTPAAQAH
jgi:uncharacterized membrane protein HdeD (DUF308 family)